MKNIILIVILLVVIAVLVQFVVKSPKPDQEVPIGEVPAEIVPANQSGPDLPEENPGNAINNTNQQPSQSMTPPENSDKIQMITTASGLQYGIVTEGTGAAAKSGDLVTVHYKGTLVDGREFDSSYTRGQPAQFSIGVGQLIKGWDEGIPGMKVGEKRILIVPSNLAYGSNPPPGSIIGKDAPLVFTVELLDTKSQ